MLLFVMTVIGSDMYGRSKIFYGACLLLSLIGCICQAVGIANLEYEAVGDKNLDNKSDEYIDEITYSEMLYGGYFVNYGLWNLYFASLLWGKIGNNQFIRLCLACFILFVHCVCCVPYLVDESNDLEEDATNVDSDDDSYDYCTYYRNESGQFAMTAIGLVMVGLVCLVIIGINVFCYRVISNEMKSIAQLESVRLKQIYLACVLSLLIGFVIYLIGLGTVVSVSRFSISVLLLFCVAIYVLFGVIVVVSDILSYKWI